MVHPGQRERDAQRQLYERMDAIVVHTEHGRARLVEELGLTEADVPYEALRDPYGIAFWPQFKGRDGCRTPMPWRDDSHAGFSSGAPWLPVPEEHRVLAVSHQEQDASSTLNGFRAFMRWRRDQPALRWGGIRFLDTVEPVLAFVRSLGDEALFRVGGTARKDPTRRVWRRSGATAGSSSRTWRSPGSSPRSRSSAACPRAAGATRRR